MLVKWDLIFKKGQFPAKHLPLTSAVMTGPSPTWQSNTKHYNFFIMFVYETNNTFVTWYTHKFEKHLWTLKVL